MDSAADHLEQWVQGTLPLEPLADVSAFHGSFNLQSFAFAICTF